MSYRPENQSLQLICEQLLKSMHEFYLATHERIVSGEWTAPHLEELTQLNNEMSNIKVRLQKLKEETW